MQSTVDPRYEGQIVPVERIAVTGPGASMAAQEFVRQGYKIIDLGVAGIDPERTGKIPFIATVDAVDTSQAAWDGFYSYSMRVSETRTGAVVWSARGTFGESGMVIDYQNSTRTAMEAMIRDFARTFPPVLAIPKAPATPKKQDEHPDAHLVKVSTAPLIPGGL